MRMATMLLNNDSSHHAMYDGGTSRVSQEKAEDGDHWYFSRKKIEEDSPSRRDGISLKKETSIRKSYSTFLQELGMGLKMRQVRIATSIIFCHRFFLRQSHAKNDWQTIATVCMYLAGKVEESPRPVKDVILVSYGIIHKKDPAAMQRIKQKEVYEKQKELILLGERVVLGTLGFDFHVPNPYKPLVEGIEKFKLAQNSLAQIAWNFVNDGLGTSLCLQYKPHHIAAGAIFIAAKYLKVKLPSDGDKVWWQDFDITARQLEEVKNQILELYGPNRMPSKPRIGTEEEATRRRTSQGAVTSKPRNSKPTSSNPLPEQSNGGSRPLSEQTNGGSRPLPEQSNGEPSEATQKQGHENGSTKNNTSDQEEAVKVVNRNLDQSAHKLDTGELENMSKLGSGNNAEEDQESLVEDQELKPRYNDDAVGEAPQEVLKKIDKDKIKAALERRKKARLDLSREKESMDEDDLIERELEKGVELALESEKINGETRNSSEDENSHLGEVGEGKSSPAHHMEKPENDNHGSSEDSDVDIM